MAAHSATKQTRRLAGGLLALLLVAATTLLATPASAGSPQSADLSVDVSHAPGSVLTGEVVSFTLTAANAGPSPAEAVVAGMGFGYPLELRSSTGDCDRSRSSESVTCGLGDIASGDSVSVTIVVQARQSGLYTIPAAVASNTPDPTPADRATTDTLIVARGPSQAERYINGIFPIILGRNPGPASLAYWAGRWERTRRTNPSYPAKIPAGIMASSEYRRSRISDSYTRILGRAADGPSLAYWVGRAARGMPFERIERVLIGSAEFARTNAGAEVDAVFEAVLGRAPIASELVSWQASVDAGATLGGLALALQRSTEGYDVIIDDRYQRTFGTPPSAFGRLIWLIRLREGDSPEQLWARLLIGNEFLKNYPYSNDDYGSYDFTGGFDALAEALDSVGAEG